MFHTAELIMVYTFIPSKRHWCDYIIIPNKLTLTFERNLTIPRPSSTALFIVY